jgi:hypothetical protein
MAIACGGTVLSGNSGSVSMTPAGTSICLLDYTDFPTADPGLILLPEGHGFLVGDAVKFTIDGSATLVTGLTEGTDYYITAISSTQEVQVSASLGGTPVDFTNSLTEDTSGGHINMKLSDFTSVCNVTNFDLSLDREQIETTSLSCGCSSASGGLAPFKTYQPGFIDGTGSLTVQFTAEQGTMSSRLLKSSLMTDQNGAQIRLYINTVCVAGEIDNDASAYIEAPISILGFSFTVSPEDVTTATVNYALSGQPTAFTL